MVKSRQKKLDERWGLERSAKGGRFKLNRDLVGYHLTAREEITQREEEGGVKIKVLDPGPLKVKGSLAHLESVSLGYSGKGKTPGKVVLEGVNITIEQGGRVALIGAVSDVGFYLAGCQMSLGLGLERSIAHPAERERQIDNRQGRRGRAFAVERECDSSPISQSGVLHPGERRPHSHTARVVVSVRPPLTSKCCGILLTRAARR